MEAAQAETTRRPPWRCARQVLLVLAGAAIALGLMAARAHACETPKPAAQPRAAHRSVHHHEHANRHPHRRGHTRHVHEGDHKRSALAKPDHTRPGRRSTQVAQTTTDGVAVADTGANAVELAGVPTPAPTNGKPASRSAGAIARAGSSRNTILQLASANVHGNARIDVLQVAAVVNVGIAHAEAGPNVTAVTAGAPAANAIVVLRTGNARAIGTVARTAIMQSAIISGDEHSTQRSTVANAGVAVSNTGLNVVIGASGPADSGTAATGPATAIGNLSSTAVAQFALGVAQQRGVLTIDQRVTVFNIGSAIANSGGNVFAPEDVAMVQQVLSVLAPLFEHAPPPQPDARPNAPGSIATGAATAIGDASSTSVVQAAVGAVSHTEHGSVRQAADVRNAGVAVANTGLNASITNDGRALQAPAHPQPGIAGALARLLQPLTDFAWLDGPNPFAQLTASLQFGRTSLDLAGEFDGRSARNVSHDALSPRVHVRQLRGVIDVGIAIADPPRGRAAIVPPTGPAAPIATGNATSAGNVASVSVCQAMNNDAACDPRVEPAHSPAPAAHPPVTSVRRSAFDVSAANATAHAGIRNIHAGGQLPFTGSDARALAELAIALLVFGGSLFLLGRARGTTVGTLEESATAQSAPRCVYTPAIPALKLCTARAARPAPPGTPRRRYVVPSSTLLDLSEEDDSC